MPRNVGTNVENNFTRGLITEAAALAFPENACTEIYDCIITNAGRVVRRKGYEFEDNHTTKTIDRDTFVVTSYLWENVTGDGTLTVYVLQVGETLYFYKATSSPVSATALATTVDLTSFSPSGAESPGSNMCTFSDGNGDLFVAHPDLESFYVEYDTSNDTVSSTQIDLKIRDVVGLDDSLAVDERPTSTFAGLSDEHHYNLFNQGWYFNSNAAITAWDSARTDMPSNADIWWVFKDSSNAFATAEIANFDLGTTPAPKGHYILDAFNEDRSTVSGIGSFTPVTPGTKRPQTVEFFAGRVFYGGVQADGYQGKIYFSQIVENSDYYGLCYQNNDPTSEIAFDLVASDGGVISIPEAGSIIKLFSYGSLLLVFASNGTWSIGGSGDGTGFSAVDYKITKLSSVDALSPYSFVDVDGTPLWWNNEGIWTIQADNIGNLTVVSLSQPTIQTYFDAIPPTAKQFAKGAYNPVTRVVQWIFRTTTAETVDSINEYNEILNLRIDTGAFYPWTIPDNDVRIHDLFSYDIVGSSVITNTVIDGSSNTVIDGSSNQVVTTTVATTSIATRFKYLCSYPDGSNSYEFTFAEQIDEDYLDFTTYNIMGVDYTSYFVTGYKIHGDAQRFFQGNYIFVYLDQEDDASCLVRSIWDFTNTTVSNRWGTQQQIYNSALVNRDVNHRRLKLRGKGKALQLRFDSVSGKPFSIFGWSIWETGNASI